MGVQQSSAGRGAGMTFLPMVQRALTVLLLLGILLPATTVRGESRQIPTLTARHKNGPVTVRGVATGVTGAGFTLVTRRQGKLVVSLSRNTRVLEKGRRGRLYVREGDHVGVKGFLRVRSLRAIQVRIYPTKPKSTSVRGRVVAVHGSAVVIQTGSTRLALAVVSATQIRLGNDPASLRSIKPGQDVRVRLQKVGQQAIALSIHIFKGKAPKKGGRRHKRASHTPVSIRGVLSAVHPGVITITSSAVVVSVRMSKQTKIYVGNQIASARVLKPGQSIRVRGCCRGRPLVALSIHIKKAKAARVNLTIRGRVLRLTARQLVLETSQGSRILDLTQSTRYEIGSNPARERDLRLGDLVGARAYSSAKRWIATRIHIYASSRRPRSIVGRLVVARGNQLIVDARGKRFTVTLIRASRLTLNRAPAAVTALRTGDKLRVRGTVNGRGEILAQSVSATRLVIKPKSIVIHGNLLRVTPSLVVVKDAAGHVLTVRLPPGVRPRLQGRPAPGAALFPGAPLTVRGRWTAGVLWAASVTLSLRTRTEEGRIATTAGQVLRLRSAHGVSQTVNLPPTVQIADQGHRVTVAGLHAGAFVRAWGYVDARGDLRATKVEIQHPALTFTGTVVTAAPALTVKKATGEMFLLRFSATSDVSALYIHSAVSVVSIPDGARVHVEGVVGSDGSVAVTRLVVHLQHITLRGSVISFDGQHIRVQANGMNSDVLTDSSTVFTPSSQVVSTKSLVAGDVVTVYGYKIAHEAIIARKVALHRERVSASGVVDSVSTDGFTITVAGNQIHVVIGPSTKIAGGYPSDIKPGLALRVSGYRRGDGAIAATHVTISKKRYI